MTRAIDLDAVVGLAGTPTRSPTLERILDCAYESFVEHGIRATTMASVAADAGVSRIWVHRLVGSRDDLLHAVLAREVERLFLRLVTQRSGTPPPDDPGVALGEAVGVVVSYFAHHPLVRRLLDDEPALILPALAADDRFIATVTGLVSRPLAAGVRCGTDEVAAIAEAATRVAVSLIAAPGAAEDPAASTTLLIAEAFGPALRELSRGGTRPDGPGG